MAEMISKTEEEQYNKLHRELSNIKQTLLRLDTKSISAKTVQGIAALTKNVQELTANISYLSSQLVIDESKDFLEKHDFVENVHLATTIHSFSAKESTEHFPNLDFRRRLEKIQSRFNKEQLLLLSTSLSDIKLPCFFGDWYHGEDPREWLSEVNALFEFYLVADELRVDIAKKFLREMALVWFYNFTETYPNTNWELFSTALCERFKVGTKISESTEAMLETFEQEDVEEQMDCEISDAMLKSQPIDGEFMVLPFMVTDSRPPLYPLTFKDDSAGGTIKSTVKLSISNKSGRMEVSLTKNTKQLRGEKKYYFGKAANAPCKSKFSKMLLRNRLIFDPGGGNFPTRNDTKMGKPFSSSYMNLNYIGCLLPPLKFLIGLETVGRQVINQMIVDKKFALFLLAPYLLEECSKLDCFLVYLLDKYYVLLVQIVERAEGSKECNEQKKVRFMARFRFSKTHAETFSIEIFKQVFVAIQSCAVHLQKISQPGWFALIPINLPLLAYQSNFKTMLTVLDDEMQLVCDWSYKIGDTIVVWCESQPNSKLLIEYGCNHLVVQVVLSTDDSQYQGKNFVTQRNGELWVQDFQNWVRKQKAALSIMLSHLRLGHVSDHSKMQDIMSSHEPIFLVSRNIKRAVQNQLVKYDERRRAKYSPLLSEDNSLWKGSFWNPMNTKFVRLEKKILHLGLEATLELIRELLHYSISTMTIDKEANSSSQQKIHSNSNIDRGTILVDAKCNENDSRCSSIITSSDFISYGVGRELCTYDICLEGNYVTITFAQPNHYTSRVCVQEGKHVVGVVKINFPQSKPYSVENHIA